MQALSLVVEGMCPMLGSECLSVLSSFSGYSAKASQLACSPKYRVDAEVVLCGQGTGCHFTSRQTALDELGPGEAWQKRPRPSRTYSYVLEIEHRVGPAT